MHLAKCQLLFLLETDVKLICACLDGLETFIDSRMAGLTYNLAACLANRGLNQDAIQLFSRCRRYYALCITEHSPLVRKLFKPVQGEIQSLLAVKNYAKCTELTNEILVKLPAAEWLAEDNLRQLQCFISLSVVAKTKSENITFHSICDLFDEWNLDIFEIELKYVSQQGLEDHYFHLLKQGSTQEISPLKKATFLEFVKRNLLINVEIRNVRIEKIDNMIVDTIVSRAVTSTNKLIGLCDKIIDAKTKVLLMKSNTQLEELNELALTWNFELQIHQNKYINNHVVFEIGHLKKK